MTESLEKVGYRCEVATSGPDAAKLIEREFGVSYHPGHVGRILKAIGWSRQKPVTRASQRDGAAIERWRIEKWLEIKKKPQMRDEP